MTNNKLPTTEQIELRAYELYLERGGEIGRDVDDWLAAERELTERVRTIHFQHAQSAGCYNWSNKYRFVILKPPQKGHRKTAGTKQARPLCQKCARIDAFRAIGVSFERKADSPNY